MYIKSATRKSMNKEKLIEKIFEDEYSWRDSCPIVKYECDRTLSGLGINEDDCLQHIVEKVVYDCSEEEIRYMYQWDVIITDITIETEAIIYTQSVSRWANIEATVDTGSQTFDVSVSQSLGGYYTE